ncbi:MAG: TetR/AcrR family transcriptional regulator [Pseudomonadota bacterium]|nr:TetR/AcrR family transcriptional regulator [Pseudomonadota bacterium]
MNVPEKPRVGRPPAYTQEQLLARLVQAAVDLLEEQGADADVSVAKIAARARVSKKTVYTAIVSKEELISQVIRHNVESVTALLDLPGDSAVAARATLERFLAEWERMASGSTAIGIYVMAIRERSRYPAIGASYHRSRAEHGVQKLAGWLQRMHSKKFIKVNDPTLTAEFLLAMVASERQRRLALGIPSPLSDTELGARVAAIMQFIFPGH